jgi:hypothetical protein
MECWIKEIIDEFAGPSKDIIVGKRYLLDGVPCLIVSGSYYGTLAGEPYGICNFWNWQEIGPDGSLGEKQHGYGMWEKVELLGG